MGKCLLPIPGKWKQRWGLVWVYWFSHWFFVNLMGIRHLCWDPMFLLHDLEKPIKLTIGIPYMRIKQAHKGARHHLNACCPRDKWRICEALCDWEASHFTKPDGPLLAKETGEKYHPDLMPMLEPYMKKYGFWH